jgi:hypothetical protein
MLFNIYQLTGSRPSLIDSYVEGHNPEDALNNYAQTDYGTRFLHEGALYFVPPSNDTNSDRFVSLFRWETPAPVDPPPARPVPVTL